MSVNISLTDGDGNNLANWRTDEDGTHHTIADLTFAHVSMVNRARCVRWQEDAGWTGADWSNAMCGEAGELANVVKKLRRAETGAANALDPPPAELLSSLRDEIADVFLYLDLVANFYGFDLAECIVPKFNRTSEKQSFPERLP